MEIVEFHPEPEQYAFTFGGVPAIRKIRPGTVLRLWTDDAFCGALRATGDMPSAKLTMPCDVATADPELEPPGTSFGSIAFLGIG